MKERKRFTEPESEVTRMSSAIEKAGFVVSVALLAFLYGFAAHARDWFPKSLVEQSWRQTRTVMSTWSSSPPMLTSRVYEREGIKVERPEEVQPGLTLVNSVWEDSDGWEPAYRLVDSSGTTVHEWKIDRGELFADSLEVRGKPELAGFHGSHLYPDGDLVVNVEYVGTVRLDACGNVEWLLPEGGHHSIERATDGSLWIPGVSRKLRRRTEQYPEGFPGLRGHAVWLDKIMHVSGEGGLLETINVLDILYANDLERYVAKGYQPQTGKGRPDTRNPTHLNDVEPLSPSMADEYPLFQAGDLLVSLRNINLVFVFDPDSGEVKWHASDPFIQQHDPDFIGRGGLECSTTIWTLRAAVPCSEGVELLRSSPIPIRSRSGFRRATRIHSTRPCRGSGRNWKMEICCCRKCTLAG